MPQGGGAQAKDTGSWSVCEATDSGVSTKPSFQFLRFDIRILGFLETGCRPPAGSFCCQIPQQAEGGLGTGALMAAGESLI